VALPTQHEEGEPSFVHHGANELPVVEDHGKRVRLICGSLYGARSPVRLLSDMFYAEVILDRDARLPVPTDYEERAAYLVEGSISIDGELYHAGQLIVFKPRSEIILNTPGNARLMLLGGEPLEGRRHIWWNFVSSSPERIEQAKDDWKSGRFSPVIDETEFIPLPESGPVVVRYP
jgi:redox-sensitive bicupin YhaK (pirin superfamily)